MKKLFSIVIFYFVLMFISYPLRGVDIGSDTSVTRFNTQQLVQDGDRVAGFAALDAGFLLGGSDVTGTWDTFFPVSGVLDFNFGTLILNQDLVTQNISEIDHLGNITGNGHVLDLSQSFKCIPTQSGLEFCSITFTFEEIEGDSVNTVDVSFDNEYNVFGEGSTLSVHQIINENFLDDIVSVSIGKTINSVNWHPSKDFIAFGTASGVGDEVFTYTFDRVGETLTLIDSVNYGSGGNNSVNAVAWHPDGDHLAVGSDSSGKELRVYEINSDGTFGASVTVALAQDVNAVAWDADGGFLASGSDSGGGFDELRVYSFVKSPLGLTLNASESVATVNSISWNKLATANNELVVGLQSGTDRLQVYRHDSGGGTLTFVAGNSGTAVNAVDWSTCCDCLVAGLQNNAEGTGGELRVYSFIDDVLDQEDDQEIGDNVLAVAWSPNGRLLLVGDDGLGAADPTISLYRFDAKFVDTSQVTWSNVQVFFNSNDVLDFTAIKFSGTCGLHGRGHLLSLSPTFSIIVDSDSTLIFNNMKLIGVGGGKLRLTDNTSHLIFSNTTIILDDDWLFDTGHFEVFSEAVFRGAHSFIYQSTEVSTIFSKAVSVQAGVDCVPGFAGSLAFEVGTTFSYDSTISCTLLKLEDENARLILHSATLAVTTSLQLTKGIFEIDGKCTFDSADGIILGNEIVSENLLFNVLPAAHIDVTSGKLIYKNA